MRLERLYLLDIIEAADAIQSFLTDLPESSFLESDLVRSAVLQKLLIIGEAAARLPKSFCDRFPEIDWKGLVGFRNIAIHAYFAVEWPIVWVSATEEVPLLRRQISTVLEQDGL